VIRVFPRETKATPVDELVYIGDPPLIRPDVSEVHVSCTFTWDKREAERLAGAWSQYYDNVKLGGVAFGNRGGEFVPGRYLRKGYVITSRGCNNRCWFCDAWRREGKVRELPITEGWNVLDNNLLQCSESHIRAVFEMLQRQSHPIEFTGGFDASLLQDWHIDLLLALRLKQVFFAYDTPDDFDPLIVAAKKLKDAGVIKPTSHKARCFVLIGYPKDGFDSAEIRLLQAQHLGFTPMAMLWRGESGETTYEWRQFQREWARPIIIHA
jgi:hypothetical protein